LVTHRGEKSKLDAVRGQRKGIRRTHTRKRLKGEGIKK